MSRKLLPVLFALGAVALLATALFFILSANVATAEPEGSFEIVADNLNNPRGIDVAPDGTVYIAEAGRGGASALCLPNPEGGPDICYGATGGVTRVTPGGMQERIVGDMASLAVITGTAATGPHDVVYGPDGNLYVTVGLGADPADRALLGSVGDQFGQLARVTLSPTITWTNIADIAAHEAMNNPDGSLVDSNPYGVQAGMNEWWVTDAGGNDLLHIDGTGGMTPTISTVAVFPTRTVPFPFPPPPFVDMEAVPTGFLMGPGNTFYVGELTGFPFPVDGAQVYEVNGGVSVYEAGFTNIVDIAFGTDGSLYVLEMATNSLLTNDPTGAIIRVAPDGSQTVLASSSLFLPTGMAMNNTGDALYVSNNGIFPGGPGGPTEGGGQPTGHVIKIPLSPTDVSLTGFEGQTAAGTPLLLAVFLILVTAVVGLRVALRQTNE